MCPNNHEHEDTQHLGTAIASVTQGLTMCPNDHMTARTSGIPTWLLALIRMCPVTGPSGLLAGFSMLRLARASSPNMERAYRLAAMNPHSPNSAYKRQQNMVLDDSLQM